MCVRRKKSRRPRRVELPRRVCLPIVFAVVSIADIPRSISLYPRDIIRSLPGGAFARTRLNISNRRYDDLVRKPAKGDPSIDLQKNLQALVAPVEIPALSEALQWHDISQVRLYREPGKQPDLLGTVS